MHVMMDIETLGVKPGCVVMQVAMVRFDHERVYTGGREWNIDIMDQLGAGLTIDMDTLQWWRDQNRTVRGLVMNAGDNRYRLPLALQDMHDALAIELANKDFKLWANPDWFDLPMVAELYYKSGREYPWPRSQTTDARTFLWAAGIDWGKRTKSIQPHHAIRDAEAQAFDVIIAAKKLGVNLR